ncbi:Na/Pi symporter [candidate division KSB1 bacterium]|nr:Na/Pi symporter [candidate division KSB1 bacterium]MBL7094824.1 Na/Pi symporter [candidate division KSB1 bacterium]
MVSKNNSLKTKNRKFENFLSQYRDRKIYTFGELLLRILSLIALLYIFMLSITMMGSAFKLFGKGFANQLIATTSNPFVGLVIGILATSIVQSSSTTTSIVVGLVGVNVLSIGNAIPIVMGANIGTSVTNTLVSLGHISRSDEFERAFSASTVHDFFNLIAVLVIFPIQYYTNILGISSDFLAGTFQNIGGLKAVSPIKMITEPVVTIITDISGQSGIIVLIISLLLLFITLRYLVKVLKSLIIGKLEKFFDRIIFRNAFISLMFGVIITSLVQSSSITTSLIVPLVGAGILTIEQIFPYTLGANIGTTVTAMLAAMATGNIAAITVAFAHFSFNIFGTILIFPIRSVPINMAKWMSKLSLKSKIYPILYIVLVFFLFPFLTIYFLR